MQFLYNGILFGNVKEWSTAACLQHDEPQRHVKWKKPGEKCHILYDSIFVKCLEKTNLLKKKKVDELLSRIGSGIGDKLQMDMTFLSFEGDGNIWKL